MASGDDHSMEILLNSVESGRNRRNQHRLFICKVSNVLRSHSPTCFDPRVVSIGPLHRKDENVKELEGLKQSYLHDLVRRLDYTPEEVFKDCLQKVFASMEEIKGSYDVTESIGNDDLASMMVMDGCFILEFCYKHVMKEDTDELHKFLIACDLLLLENQIPFFVLQNLFDCTLGKQWPCPYSLTEIIYKAMEFYIHPFTNPFPTEFPITNVATDATPDHLLGLVHKRYRLLHDNGPENYKSTNVHSAAELDRSGVNIKIHQDKNYPMTMKFESSSFTCFHCCWGRPTLRMPKIVVFDSTEKVLRNFIAYEQLFPNDNHYFTSYAWAMDMLVDTEEDISKLEELKVLINGLGSKKNVADMFNSICKDIPLPYSYYEKEFKQLDDHYNGFWPRHIAYFRRTYFSNPWSIIALIAGIILFTVTVIQTVFTILAG